MLSDVSRSKQAWGSLGMGTKAWGIVCLFLANACGAHIASEKSLGFQCEVGTEGCDCYGNWSCNYQLSCVDEVCVDRTKIAAEEAQTLSLRAADPIASAVSDECLVCLEDDCVSPLAECYDANACSGLFACLLGCSQLSVHMYTSCADECYARSPIEAHSSATQLQMCTQARCKETCD